MTDFWGADTAALAAWADRGDTAHGTLADLLEACAQAVAIAPWTGPDADDFRARFGALQGRWAATAEAVEEHATQARRHAEEQDTTSDDVGGAPGIPPMQLYGDPKVDPFGFATDPTMSADQKIAAFLHFLADTINGPTGAVAEHLTRGAEELVEIAMRARRMHPEDLERFIHSALDKLDSAEDLGKIGKVVGGIDLAVSVYDAGRAIYDGRTGDAIGKLTQIAFELSPPGRAIGVADALAGMVGGATGFNITVGGQKLDFSTNSPLDLLFQGYGNQIDDSPLVDHGERTGQQISDSLGLSRDGHARKALTAGGGALAYAYSFVNPFVNIANQIGWGVSKVGR